MTTDRRANSETHKILDHIRNLPGGTQYLEARRLRRELCRQIADGNADHLRECKTREEFVSFLGGIIYSGADELLNDDTREVKFAVDTSGIAIKNAILASCREAARLIQRAPKFAPATTPHLEETETRLLEALRPFVEAARVGLIARAGVTDARRDKDSKLRIEDLSASVVEVGVIAATRQLTWSDFQRALDAVTENSGGVA